MEAFANKIVVKNMGQKYKDSAKAAAEADRIASIAEQNLQEMVCMSGIIVHRKLKMTIHCGVIMFVSIKRSIWTALRDHLRISVCSALPATDLSVAQPFKALEGLDYVTIVSKRFWHNYFTFGIVAGRKRKKLLSLGPLEKIWPMLPFKFLPFDWNDPVTGDGGLLCGRHSPLSSRTNQVEDLELYVCNPLTQAWRKLPIPLLVQKFDLLHLVTDRQTKQYTITVVNDLQEGKQFIYNTKAVVEVYNSSTNMWTAGNGIFHQSSGTNLIYYKKYIVGEFVGIRAYDKATGYTSIAFNVTEDTSLSVDCGISPLTECQGQIYKLLQTEGAASGIWVLQGLNHEWEKICSLPESLRHSCGHNFSLYASADVLIILVGRRGRNYYCIWMFDRAQGRWIDVLNRLNKEWIWKLRAFDLRGRGHHFMLELRLDGIP